MIEDHLQKKFVETGKGKIYYFLDNSFPSRPMVVFLHGLTANHTTWLNTMEFLRAQKYNTLALDMRGHGYSDKTKNKSFYELPIFCEDLNQIIARENIGKFFLVGYSFGGTVAIDFAIKNSQKLLGLVLVSTNYANPLEHLKLKFLTPLVLFFVNSAAFLLLWQKRKQYIYFREGSSRGYWHSVWTGLNTIPLSLMFWFWALVGRLDFKTTIQQIKTPTLIFRAKNDPFLSLKEASEMADSIPNAVIVTPQKNDTHFLPAHAWEEISEIILDFLQKHENSNF